MARTYQHFIYIIVILFTLLSITINAQTISQLLSTPMYDGETKSRFNGQYACKEFCTTVIGLGYEPKSNTTIDYTSIDITLIYATTKLDQSSKWKVYTYTLTPTTTNITFTDIPEQNALIYIYGNITFTSSHYENKPIIPTHYMTDVFFRTSLTAAPAIHTYQIQHLWTSNLLLPNMPGVVNPDVPDPTTYNFGFTPQTEWYLSSDTAHAYKLTTSFTQYQWSYIQSIDLALIGTNYWYYNETEVKLGGHYCTLNGESIVPTIISPQQLRLEIPSVTSESLIAGAVMTLVCGTPGYGLTIVQDNIIANVLGENHIQSELFVMNANYAIVEGFGIPLGSITIPLSTGEYNLLPYYSSSGINISPQYTLIDVNGKGIFSIYEIEFTDLEQYKQSFELDLKILGLRIRQPNSSTNNKKPIPTTPHVFIEIDPDYTNEHIESKVTALTYILPLNITDGTIPTLRLNDIFTKVYTDGQLPSIFFTGGYPKRYIHITIPLDAIEVEYYPVTTQLTIRPIKKEETTPTPQSQLQLQFNNIMSSLGVINDGSSTTLALSTYPNLTPIQTNKQNQLPYKISRVLKNKLTFDVTPTGATSFYPDNMRILYPSSEVRIRYPQVTSVRCYQEYLMCTGSGKSRSCRMYRDNNFQITPAYFSQYRFDINIRAFTSGVPSAFRRVICRGVNIVKAQTLVYDYRKSTEKMIISDSNPPTPTTGWSEFKKSGITPLVSHTLLNQNTLYGASEQLGVKKPMSTGAIVALALLPVYLAVIIVPIVLCCCFCCD